MKFTFEGIKADISKALLKNKKAIMAEIYETQELIQLLTKATHTKLSVEEKRKVNDQILDIIKTVPALAIFALPGGAFILPLVLKILPFDLLPDNFYKPDKYTVEKQHAIIEENIVEIKEVLATLDVKPMPTTSQLEK